MVFLTLRDNLLISNHSRGGWLEECGGWRGWSVVGVWRGLVVGGWRSVEDGGGWLDECGG